jgi:hypothetical protein
MSAAEVIQEIERLPSQEQEQVFALLTRKIMSNQQPDAKQWLGKRLSFEDACDVVLRENRELLSLLAK